MVNGAQTAQCWRGNVGVYFCVVRLRVGAACAPLLLFTRRPETTGHTDTWNTYGNAALFPVANYFCIKHHLMRFVIMSA